MGLSSWDRTLYFNFISSHRSYHATALSDLSEAPQRPVFSQLTGDSSPENAHPGSLSALVHVGVVRVVLPPPLPFEASLAAIATVMPPGHPVRLTINPRF